MTVEDPDDDGTFTDGQDISPPIWDWTLPGGDTTRQSCEPGKGPTGTHRTPAHPVGVAEESVEVEIEVDPVPSHPGKGSDLTTPAAVAKDLLILYDVGRRGDLQQLVGEEDGELFHSGGGVDGQVNDGTEGLVGGDIEEVPTMHLEGEAGALLLELEGGG